VADSDNRFVSSQATSASDAEAIRYLEQAVTGGKHWYIALLESIGLWTSTEENCSGRTYRYLINGEAFDWLLLAERLCEAVDGILPDGEKDDLLFYGKPPLSLSSEEVKGLIGNGKYCQYLNYFYGITVEGALILAVQEEVYKGRWMLGHMGENEATDEAYRRIYDATKTVMLQRFKRERGYPQRRSVTLTELKEFTYWLFKYRLRRSEKAKVASDTRKALDYLKRQCADKGFLGALLTDAPFADCH